MNYFLKDSSVKVSPSMKPIISEIGNKFKQKFNKTIWITSGTRTAKEQASAMYNNFSKEKGTEIQRKKYTGKKLFDEIATIYYLYKDKGKTICVQKMEKVIKDQILKEKFISLHLVESAVDIRTRGFQKKEIDYIIELIKTKRSILSYQDKRNDAQPHIHLQLKPGIIYL